MFVRLRHGFLTLAAFVFLTAAALPVHAADAETRAFKTAEDLLRDGFHDRAEKTFADFVAKHPASSRVAQALLLESKAALAQKKFEPAALLLATNLTLATNLADQFQFG